MKFKDFSRLALNSRPAQEPWLKQRMMEVVVTTGAISRAKLQSNHHQQTNIQFLQAGCPSCRPTNSVKALKGKYHIPWTCSCPSSPGGLPTLSLTT